jgi:hypothetical protein
VVKEEVMDVLQLHTKMPQEQRLLLDKLRPFCDGNCWENDAFSQRKKHKKCDV